MSITEQETAAAQLERENLIRSEYHEKQVNREETLDQKYRTEKECLRVEMEEMREVSERLPPASIIK